MLTYMEVHLYYTLPVLGLLLWLLKPFHSTEDNLKYKFLTLVAFSTASLWDNYIVYHRAWSYCPSCVTAVIGYVPLEEYMFFIIMTLMTVAFTNLVMRWHLHSFFIKPDTPLIQSLMIRLIPIAGLLAISYKAWITAVPGKSLFYGSCILWYACPVLALLWFGAGEYMLRRPIAVLTSIIVPTVFLCWVDTVAIGAGTWDISLRTSTGKMVLPHLPVEEFMFFLLINTVLVFATCAIDRTQAIIHLYKVDRYQHQHRDQVSEKRTSKAFFQQISEMTKAFCLLDQMLNSGATQDLAVSWNILRDASKSFYTASAVFPCHIRQDLGILYGFCRATDDLCDNEDVPVEDREQQLKVTKQFVKDLFSQKTNDASAIDWETYCAQLPPSCISAFKSFTRLRHMLETDAIEELLEGYDWDLSRRPVTTEEDLRRYSACVASTVGEMCTRIILWHSDQKIDNKEFKWTLERARDMGLVLQYTNIARDIVTDSQELGRCYLPTDWLSKDELNLIQVGKARKLSEKRLLELCHNLVDKASKLKVQASRGIVKLPNNCKGGVRAACNVYAAIGTALKEQKSRYPTRAHIKKMDRAKIALLITKSITNSDHSKMRQGKIRSFIVD
ncbi:Lycopene beta-cyclase [Mycotypha africana]|uniref:Lycopene beta-cyclase n=1 Tax=Mycotypha africana TaxID=64632 RepID=UPI00230120C7|nr:Lycopene beta-cyclase [Mycotypha africana]KAI8991654.1 Lycopene beta-cyclase [Mycotypha africana]